MKNISASLPLLALLILPSVAAGAPDFTSVTRNTDGTMRLEVPSRADSYYIVWKNTAADLSPVWAPETVTSGTGNPLTLHSLPNAAPRGFYRAEEIPLTDTSRDTDSDGMPDTFELLYPGCLHPLLNDAAGNCDNDALTNLAEYLAGTDPTVPNSGGGGGLVINEVDYDQTGTDTTEFVEILNTSTTAIPLQGISLVLINGANSNEYDRVDLGPAGSLAAGQYLVVGPSSVTGTLPTGVLSRPFAVVTNAVQNGAPDGAALINVTTSTVIDALSYEGSITAANVTGFPSPVSLVEGTPSTLADSNTALASLSRQPNGTDTNNAATDWILSTTPTPGTANLP